jgi:hypothetical protein
VAAAAGLPKGIHHPLLGLQLLVRGAVPGYGGDHAGPAWLLSIVVAQVVVLHRSSCTCTRIEPDEVVVVQVLGVYYNNKNLRGNKPKTDALHNVHVHSTPVRTKAAFAPHGFVYLHYNVRC